MSATFSSQYESVMRGDPKTNNHIDGWHNRYKGIVDEPHTSIYAVIKALKKEAGYYRQNDC